MRNVKNESNVLKIVNWLTDKAISGVHPLSSAEDLATEYLIDRSYPDDEERIESLINWETTKNFTSGFITGLGGLITFPITIPSIRAIRTLPILFKFYFPNFLSHNIYSQRLDFS